MASRSERGLEEGLRVQAQQLGTITEAMTTFLDRGDWGVASSRLLVGALDLTGSVYGFVGVLVEGAFRVLAHQGIVWDAAINRDFYEEALRSYEAVGYLEFRSFDNLFGHVLTTGEALIANDAPNHPYAGGIPDGHPRLDHFLGVPFLWRNDVVGMIGVANRSGGYSSREQEQLEGLAQAAGVLYDSYRRQLKEQEFERERTQAEATLRESNRRLEEALAELRTTQQAVVREERLRALGLMASGVAHDFNNALQPIVGFARLLLQERHQLRDPEVVAEYLEMINTAADDAARLVKRLSDFYRRREDDQQLKPTDLNQVVEQVIRLTRPKWRDEAMARGLAIDVEADLGDLPRVAADDAELREMLTNVIFNAIDAMPDGGLITLRTRLGGDEAVLEVSDTGFGMSEEVRLRCFDPFFSTKTRPGTGLGLAMVYGVMERHGGRIEVDSAPSEGATFRFLLPLGLEMSAAPELAPRPETERPKRHVTAPLRILLVEDDPRVRRAIETFLAHDGHVVETASNGLQGLERFAARSFDLVITDHAMPGLTGHQLARAVKAQGTAKPVILLSGFGELIRAARQSPAVDLVLGKPVTPSALRDAIAEAMTPPAE